MGRGRFQGPKYVWSSEYTESHKAGAKCWVCLSKQMMCFINILVIQRRAASHLPHKDKHTKVDFTILVWHRDCSKCSLAMPTWFTSSGELFWSMSSLKLLCKCLLTADRGYQHGSKPILSPNSLKNATVEGYRMVWEKVAGHHYHLLKSYKQNTHSFHNWHKF